MNTPKQIKLIKRNKFVQGNRLVEGKWVFEAVDVPGPLVLASGIKEKDDLQLAAGIVSRYCSKKQSPKVSVKYENKSKGVSGFLEASPVSEEKLEEWRV